MSGWGSPHLGAKDIMIENKRFYWQQLKLTFEYKPCGKLRAIELLNVFKSAMFY